MSLVIFFKKNLKLNIYIYIITIKKNNRLKLIHYKYDFVVNGW